MGCGEKTPPGFGGILSRAPGEVGAGLGGGEKR